MSMPKKPAKVPGIENATAPSPEQETAKPEQSSTSPLNPLPEGEVGNSPSQSVSLPAPSPEAPQNEAFKAVSSINKRVREIPYWQLMNAVRNSFGHTPVDAEFLRYRGGDVVNQLSFEARIGNEKAVVALRDLGIEIANALAGAIGRPEDPVSKNIENASSFVEDGIDDDAEVAYAMPGQLLEQLVNLTAEDLRECLNGIAREPAADTPVMFEDVFLTLPDEPTTKKSKKDKQKEKESKAAALKPVEPEEPDMDSLPVAPVDMGVRSPAPTQTDEEIRQGLAIEILRRLVGRRVIHVARRVALRVASESGMWPLAISALPRNRTSDFEKYISEIKLGINSPTVQMVGSCDASTVDSPVAVFEFLNNERLSALSYAPIHREMLRRSLEILNTNNSYPPDYDGPKWERTRLRAALLPELTDSPEVIREWVDLGMLYLSYRCDGDFSRYEWFKEGSKKNNTGKSDKNLMSDRLRAGLKKFAT